ncbi:hypothetical protein WG219_02625 [Ectopseudomonas mendocina]|uniref:Uncharacterized protein n=1 Tax=Ectopseudomonas mendocina TaxID=300 RepID=A0ABZ2RHB6_ECTME
MQVFALIRRPYVLQHCRALLPAGQSIQSAAVVQVAREGPFWVLHTLSGSFYVILSFNILRGAQSLDDYLQRLLTMAHPEPWQLH